MKARNLERFTVEAGFEAPATRFATIEMEAKTE
jgi:hypothetical protein